MRAFNRFWFDIVLGLAFTAVYSVRFTGQWVHEWLGLALGLALVIHLTLHWTWAVRTTRDLRRAPGRRHLLWTLNLALLVAITACVTSGVITSDDAVPALGYVSRPHPYWSHLHSLTATVTLILVPVHVALRWRWLAGMSRALPAQLGRRWQSRRSQPHKAARPSR